MSEPRVLQRAAERASNSKAFLAWDIAHLLGRHVVERAELSEKLKVRLEDLPRLELCRTPRRDPEHFRSDIAIIADYAAADASTLAQLVRLSDALLSLSAATSLSEEPAERERVRLLAAARDEANERTVVSTLPPAGAHFQPTWLHQATSRFWTDDSPREFPWPVELEVLMRLPLALVELDRLATDRIGDWLTANGAPLHLHAAPRPLVAALVAYAGRGVIFIDSNLSEKERRVSIAHEAAHFLSDYLLPREHVEQVAPDLVDVIDGLRDVDQADSVTALLARVPLGIHAHLLARSTSGEFISREVEDAEERATRISWELLAPQESIVHRVGDLANAFVVTRMLEEEFGLPTSTARAYSKFLMRLNGVSDPLKDRFGVE